MKSTTLTQSTTVVAVENALSTTIDGETVILHRDVGKYYGLNEVGTFIWELLQEPRTIDELCRAVVDEYDVHQDRSRSDIDDLLAKLIQRDLVRLDES